MILVMFYEQSYQKKKKPISFGTSQDWERDAFCIFLAKCAGENYSAKNCKRAVFCTTQAQPTNTRAPK